MGEIKKNKNYTEQEYLVLERESVNKYEFYKGEVFAMAGASRNHNLIQGNLLGLLNPFLKNKNCSVFPSDMRVFAPSLNFYTYPDLSIVCGEEKYLDDVFDTLLNPKVIIEILSKTTSSYDRGDKFFLYRSIESLEEYILIDSLSYKVESFTKNERKLWELQEVSDLKTSFLIKSIGFECEVGEIYDKVRFLNSP